MFNECACMFMFKRENLFSMSYCKLRNVSSILSVFKNHLVERVINYVGLLDCLVFRKG